METCMYYKLCCLTGSRMKGAFRRPAAPPRIFVRAAFKLLSSCESERWRAVTDTVTVAHWRCARDWPGRTPSQ
eukprot:3373226-Rhodomonas_salina.1